ncbi:MAG: hypothetical protein ABJA77_12175 [Variovorax sp.]
MPDPNVNGQVPADVMLDAFHNAYHYFVEAVKVLSHGAEAQCIAMGDYDVAWEIKDDVGAGRYLVGKTFLGAPEEQAIVHLIAALEGVPEHVLHAASGREASLRAMLHPSWAPLRGLAARVLQDLRISVDENRRFLAGSP